MNSIAYWMTRLLLLTLFLVLSAALLIPLFTLLEELLGQHTTLRAILGILALGWLLLMLRTADVMASKMVFEGLGFLEAFRLCILEARVAIGFVPIIGQWVAPKPEKPDAERSMPID